MPEVSLPFVVLMGIGTVFFGLICIIFLSMAMSAICRSMGGAPVPAPAVRRRREPILPVSAFCPSKNFNFRRGKKS